MGGRVEMMSDKGSVGDLGGARIAEGESKWMRRMAIRMRCVGGKPGAAGSDFAILIEFRAGRRTWNEFCSADSGR